MRIRKGDKVTVIKGKDRGKSGKVLEVFSKDSRVSIEGLNLAKKSVRPRREKEKGQIVSVPRPMRVENVQIICPSCGKPTRVGIKVTKDKKERYCKKCNAIV